jgi:hypothetical protein
LAGIDLEHEMNFIGTGVEKGNRLFLACFLHFYAIIGVESKD